MTRILVCMKNPDHDKGFEVSAVEHHVWHVTKYDVFLNDLGCGECYKVDMPDYFCHECGSEARWEEAEEDDEE